MNRIKATIAALLCVLVAGEAHGGTITTRQLDFSTSTPYTRTWLLADDAAEGRSTLGLGTAATENTGAFQAASANLTTFAGIAPSANVQTLLGSANFAAFLSSLGGQPIDGDLTAIAALSGTSTIYYRSASNTWTAVTIGSGLDFTGGTLTASGSGVGDPGGSDTQLQYNNGGVLSGASTVTYNDATNILSLGEATATGEVYGAGWEDDTGVATKGDIWEVIESLSGAGVDLSNLPQGQAIAFAGTGGTLDNCVIGGTTPKAGTFSTLSGPLAFTDADGLWTATTVQTALEELNDSINAGVPNGTGAKVHWAQLTGVPAGIADGIDEGGSGGSGTLTTIKENNTGVGGADIVALDFLGADFDLSESPDTEVQVVIAAAIARDIELNDLAADPSTNGSFDPSAWLSHLDLTFEDSPQFLAVNIGHASDTTITRVSAGVIAVEGATILTAAAGDAAYQPLAAALTSWEAITRAAGFDTFVATPSIANFFTLVTGEGTGVADAAAINVGSAGSFVVNGGALGTPSSGNGSNLTNIPGTAVSAASTTAVGVAEAAIASEVTTGTDADRYVSPDALAGSVYGTRTLEFVVFDWTTDIATGTGKFYFRVPPSLNGFDIIYANAQVVTAGTTGDTTIQIVRRRGGTPGTGGTAVDVLDSDPLDINSTEANSDDGDAGTISTSNDDLATGDFLEVSVTAVSTTAPKGLIVTLEARKP